MKFKHILTDIMSSDPAINCSDDSCLDYAPWSVLDILGVADRVILDFEEDGFFGDDEGLVLSEMYEERQSCEFVVEIYTFYLTQWLARRMSDRSRFLSKLH